MVPHKGREEWFWKETNFIPLCSACHNTVTSKFDYKYVVGSSIEPKTNWLNLARAQHEALADKKFDSVKIVKVEEWP